MAGRLDDPYVPQSDWRCTGVEDFGRNDLMCEMCEANRVRFVHVMEHDDVEDAWRVGVCCAARMEEDTEVVVRRDRWLRARGEKRDGWCSFNWKPTSSGGFYLRSDGFVCMVKRDDRGWGGGFVKDKMGQFPEALTGWTWGKKIHASIDAAKLAVFDRVWPLQFRE